jgi:hypothetical protein
LKLTFLFEEKLSGKNTEVGHGLSAHSLFFWKLFWKFFYVYLQLKKLINKKYFLVKKKIRLVFRKVFSFLNRKHFSEVVNNLKMSYYLLIISNLVIELLIAIYFVLNLFFSISYLRIWFDLIFILTLVLIFIIVIWFSLIIFNWIFLFIKYDPYSFDSSLFNLK